MNNTAPKPLPSHPLPEIDVTSTDQRELANTYYEDLAHLNYEQTHWLERFEHALQLSDWGLS